MRYSRIHHQYHFTSIARSARVWVNFDDFSGRFVMPRRNLNTRHAVVDINADSLKSGTGFVGVLLKSDSFFDVENFPTIRFVGSNLEWYGEYRAELRGG